MSASSEPSALPASVIEQQRLLAERVRASSLYRHEVGEFSVAVRAYAALLSRLGVVEDLGSLTSPESRNLVRLVRCGDGSAAVLKVVGNTREPGEGEVLDAWYRLALPCAEPLGWGYQRVPPASGGGSAAWLLTRHLPGGVLGDDAGADLPGRVGALLGFVAPFHASTARVSSARSWAEHLDPHLRQTLPLVRRAGLRQPTGWQRRLGELSGRGRTLVHADPAGINVIVGDDGRWTLIDPPGAVVAMREADAAQIAWHTGGPRRLEEAVDAVCEADVSLVPSAVAGFAAFNLLVWAGYELADHAIAGRPVGGGDPDAGHQAAEEVRGRAQSVLDQAGELLARR